MKPQMTLLDQLNKHHPCVRECVYQNSVNTYYCKVTCPAIRCVFRSVREVFADAVIDWLLVAAETRPTWKHSRAHEIEEAAKWLREQEIKELKCLEFQ